MDQATDGAAPVTTPSDILRMAHRQCPQLDQFRCADQASLDAMRPATFHADHRETDVDGSSCPGRPPPGRSATPTKSRNHAATKPRARSTSARKSSLTHPWRAIEVTETLPGGRATMIVSSAICTIMHHRPLFLETDMAEKYSPKTSTKNATWKEDQARRVKSGYRVDFLVFHKMRSLPVLSQPAGGDWLRCLTEQQRQGRFGLGAAVASRTVGDTAVVNGCLQGGAHGGVKDSCAFADLALRERLLRGMVGKVAGSCFRTLADCSPANA